MYILVSENDWEFFREMFLGIFIKNTEISVKKNLYFYFCHSHKKDKTKKRENKKKRKNANTKQKTNSLPA